MLIHNYKHEPKLILGKYMANILLHLPTNYPPIIYLLIYLLSTSSNLSIDWPTYLLPTYYLPIY